MKYWTKSPGTGGQLRSEEDFVVEEIVSKKFLPKFKRTKSGVSSVSGPYTLALLKKKGVTTEDAVKFLLEKFGLQKDDVSYAGLKDKFGVTSQYITVKGKTEDLKTEKIEFRKIGFTDKRMEIGDLEGNIFTISLHGCKTPKNASALVNEIEKRGMPNYFGSQRFGLYGNEKIGKMLLQRNFKKALDLINEQSRKRFSDIRAIEKKKLKFFVHAYQSHIFNEILDKYISKHDAPFFEEFEIIGSNTKLKNNFAGKGIRKILKKDGIEIKDFAFRELSLNVTGSSRPAFIAVGIDYEVKGDSIVLKFQLPKGSYATVLIREIVKNKGP